MWFIYIQKRKKQIHSNTNETEREPPIELESVNPKKL